MVEPSGDIEQLYGRSYQEGSVAPRALSTWREIARVLLDHFPSKSWIDVGCGGGGLLRALKDLGVDNVWGIEGASSAQGFFPDLEIVMHDLRVPYIPSKRAEVVTCFDVAEHVGAAGVLVDTICHLSRQTVIFGAASPGQDGLGHIDLRPPEEWEGMFHDRGWKYCPIATTDAKDAIRERDHNYLWWVEKNLQVFRLA